MNFNFACGDEQFVVVGSGDLKLCSLTQRLNSLILREEWALPFVTKKSSLGIIKLKINKPLIYNFFFDGIDLL